MDSQDTRSEALISSLEQSGVCVCSRRSNSNLRLTDSKSQVWRLLHLKFQLRYSDINTFEVHLEDAIFTESVISKFNTNLLERDAIDTLDSVNVDIKYHTASYNHQHFKRELNYLHYSMLLCHWEHQMPFIFNIKTRELLLNNLDNMGNLSFSLTNSSQLMIKLMRTIESQAESLTSQLEELSKNSKNRGRCKSTYPIQFFG